jgi:hypothetical protein
MMHSLLTVGVVATLLIAPSLAQTLRSTTTATDNAAGTLLIPDLGLSLQGSQVQISDTGAVGDRGADAYSPAIAYNSIDNQFLVVWVSYENEWVYSPANLGVRIDAATGALLGERGFISSNYNRPDVQGGPNNPQHCTPAVAHNSTTNEYLVVSPALYPPVIWAREIYGQRVAADGVPVGSPVRLTQMTQPGGYPLTEMTAGCAAVAYNPAANEYLLAWTGRTGYFGHQGPCATDAFYQRLSAAGVPVAKPTRLFGCRWVAMGAPDVPLDRAPGVTYNRTTEEYLVASTADGGIRAWRISAGGASASVGTGSIGRTCDDAVSIAANTATADYLLVWNAAAGVLGCAAGGVNARRVTGGGALLDTTVVTEAPATGTPTVAYDARTDEYLVAWTRAATDTTGREALELSGQLLSAGGAGIGRNDFRISRMGPDGDPAYSAVSPALARRPAGDDYMVVWSGDDDTGGHVDDEFEIYGRRVVPTEPYVIGLASWVGEGGWIVQREDAPTFDGIGWLQVPWPAYNATGNGVHPAMGDVDGDGLDELVLGLHASNGWLAILDDSRHDHAATWIRLAWPPGWTSYRPAVGDIDGDAPAEIVVGFDESWGWFLILDDATTNFAPIGWRRVEWPDYNVASGATHPAIGDVDGDGVGEIMVGLGRNSFGWVEVFSGAAGGYRHRAWLQVPWDDYGRSNGATYPASGDVDGDGADEIVVGLGPGALGWFAVMDDAAHGHALVRWLQSGWTAYNSANGATHPAVGNIDDDAADEIVAGLATWAGEGGWVQIFDDLIANTGAAGMAWRQVASDAYAAAGGGAYPAIAKGRGP